MSVATARARKMGAVPDGGADAQSGYPGDSEIEAILP